MSDTYASSRKVLKALSENVYPGQYWNIETLATYMHKKVKDIRPDIEHLESQGLTHSVRDYDHHLELVTTTQDGAGFLKVRADHNKSYFWKSIVIPFVVTVITTLLLRWLFPEQ